MVRKITQLTEQDKQLIRNDYAISNIPLCHLAQKHNIGYVALKRIIFPKYEETHKRIVKNYTSQSWVKERANKVATEWQKSDFGKKRMSERHQERYQNDPEYRQKRLGRNHKLYEDGYYLDYRLKYWNKTAYGAACHRKWSRIRRGLKKQVNEDYSLEDEQFTKELFDNKCAVCGTKEQPTIDHWYPLSEGNRLTRQNAVLLCRPCNARKNNQLPESVFDSATIIKVEETLTKGK